jgi:hypothetical protein
MHIPPELRAAHIFLREATMAKYYHKPNYDRFKHLAYHLNHFVLNPDSSIKIKYIAQKCVSQLQDSQYLSILRKLVLHKILIEIEVKMK